MSAEEGLVSARGQNVANWRHSSAVSRVRLTKVRKHWRGATTRLLHWFKEYFLEQGAQLLVLPQRESSESARSSESIISRRVTVIRRVIGPNQGYHCPSKPMDGISAAANPMSQATFFKGIDYNTTSSLATSR